MDEMDEFQYHTEDGTVYQGGIQQVPPPMQQQVQAPVPAPAPAQTQVKPGVNLLEHFKGGRSRKRRKITKRNNRKKMKTRRYKRSKYSYKK
jgi:hypothetical protein